MDSRLRGNDREGCLDDTGMVSIDIVNAIKKRNPNYQLQITLFNPVFNANAPR
jgi:hypothetical protein